MLTRLLTSVLFGLACLTALPAAAQHNGAATLASRDHPLPLATDFNLITAIDASDSVNRHDEALQYDGLARGVVDTQFLSRVAEGSERRIGFLAFTWSSGGRIEVVVPWTVIETRADAERVALQFGAAPRIDRTGFGRYAPLSSNTDRDRGGMTDIAEAIQSAMQLSLDAPFRAPRVVINILSDGVDNFGQNPTLARDLAVGMGFTINGVVFGDREDLPEYFRENVIGGPGAFLMTIRETVDMPEVLEKKFLQDLIASLPEPAAG
jgi:hypothetical protein